MAGTKFAGSVAFRKENGREVMDIIGLPVNNPPVPTKNREGVLLVGATAGWELATSPIGEIAVTVGATILRDVYQQANAASPKTSAAKGNSKGKKGNGDDPIETLIEQLLRRLK